jgi:hypothetical protein
MPAIRKLTAEEVQAIRQGKKVREPSQRQQVASEYDAFLADMAPGDFAEVDLAEDENRLTVANRLKAAAKRRDLAIRLIRTSGNQMRFQLVAQEDS